MAASKLQTIFERIYTDVRAKLCTCTVCSQFPVLPVFEVEHIPRMLNSGPCMLTLPTIWVAVYMTIKLVRRCGAVVRQLAYLPEEVLHQLRHTDERFTSESEFLFDARVIEAVAVAYGGFSPDDERLRRFIGPEGRVPVDYFASHRDVVRLAIEYADERRAENLAAYVPAAPASRPSLESVLEEILAEEQAEAARVAERTAKRAAKKAAKKKKTSSSGCKAAVAAAPPSGAVARDVPKPDGCVVCLGAHSAVALECGHVCVCEACYGTGIGKCPLCTKHVIHGNSRVVWPDGQAGDAVCRTCTNVFPTNMCGQCKEVTCDGCLKKCACSSTKHGMRKLFWV